MGVGDIELGVNSEALVIGECVGGHVLERNFGNSELLRSVPITGLDNVGVADGTYRLSGKRL